MNVSTPSLRERYSFSDYLYYSTLGAVPLFSAFYAVFNHSGAWLSVYILICLLAVSVVYRHYCSHCPHYTREGRLTRCIFFWGVPKVFERRPGPLTVADKALALGAFAAVILFPLYWLFQQVGLLAIFVMSLAVFFATIRRNECRRCIYFDCPVNRVPPEVKTGEEL